MRRKKSKDAGKISPAFGRFLVVLFFVGVSIVALFYGLLKLLALFKYVFGL